MLKIIESTLVSLEGVIGDPQLWAMDYFDIEAQKEALEGLLAGDVMLIGRRSYEIFAGVWPARTGDYADRLNSMRKYVFSSTLHKALIGITRRLSRAMSWPRQSSSSSRTART